MDGQVLYYASERLRDDKEVVLSAIENKPTILKYVSFRLRDDEDVAKYAIEHASDKTKKEVYSYLSERLQNNDTIKNLL